MIPELLEKYPEGSDITILNTFYQYPVFEDNGQGKRVKVCDDFIVLVYQDNKTKEKKYEIINKPEYTFYKVKEEYKADYSRLFIERDKVDPINVKFTDLEKEIAKNIGKEDEYKTNIMNRNKAANKAFHMNPDIFFSDVNIQDHYRFKFANTYTNNIEKIDKSFFDIEVDGKFAKGDFVEMGECPINCVSFHDEKSDMVYTFILRDSRNPLIQQFEDRYKSGVINQKYIHDFVVKSVGGIKQAKKYKLLNTQFKLLFYDYEIDLIRDIFFTIHLCCPTFVEGWNSSAFDLEYFIERIKTLGYDPADIMCDQRWKYKIVKNYVDQRNINELAERSDYTFISGIPVFIDQMIQYASRRKSKIGSYSSFKLDDIGELEAGVRKLDYHHITKSVVELPWLDFETFVLYNIMDVIVQKCIEIKTNDLEYIYSKCIVNNTSYNKGHRQTVYLINRMAADWYKMGYIIGNNVNTGNEKPPKYLGALVSDPLNTNGYSKLKIDGRDIWICDNLCDFDYKSLYPSIMLEFNIAPNTQIGRIVIPNKIYANENTYSIPEEKYSRSGEFIENMVTDNIIEFCHRWFGLGNFQEMLEDIDEFYGTEYGRFSNLQKAGFAQSPIIPVTDKVEAGLIFDSYGPTSPIIFDNEMPKDLILER